MGEPGRFTVRLVPSVRLHCPICNKPYVYREDSTSVCRSCGHEIGVADPKEDVPRIRPSRKHANALRCLSAIQPVDRRDLARADSPYHPLQRQAWIPVRQLRGRPPSSRDKSSNPVRLAMCIHSQLAYTRVPLRIAFVDVLEEGGAFLFVERFVAGAGQAGVEHVLNGQFEL